MSAAATAAGYLYASGRLRKTNQGNDHYAPKQSIGDLTPSANTRPTEKAAGRTYGPNTLRLPKRKSQSVVSTQQAYHQGETHAD